MSGEMLNRKENKGSAGENVWHVENHSLQRKEIQTSETLKLGILLALSGGFMDAYSYICRGGVFANAQTGNMLLLGVNLSSGQWREAAGYALPVTAFALGIAIAELIRFGMKDKNLLHWRQMTVFLEALILLLVAFIPLNQNFLANALTSFACGMQVESFRKIHGNSIATTMCIGNLRNGTQHFCEFVEKREKKHLKKGILYYGIIVFFVIGAVIGNQVIRWQGKTAIAVSSFLLMIAFLMMFADGRMESEKIGSE